MAAPGARPDHYAVLGVDPSASARQIASAYRALVRVLHPDSRPAQSSAERLGEVLAAYEVLRDPDRRAAYDARLDRRSVEQSVRPPAAGPDRPSARSVPVRVHRAEPWFLAAEHPGPEGFGRTGPWPPGPDLRVGPVRVVVPEAAAQPVDLARWVLWHWGDSNPWP
ncbi:J domain-containing protein [Kitasatospora sp. DSM 101779]|uniref:J domain-containing protein n=1 Tax=Kitasatospora sp. DSM 101779 TaxID=2853165 RepID=UPI0021DA78D8|nr:J domain-containing protein [Kitasatospora sp. DSM 101779]MCU7826748.1 J domain-containing protein [Kitasatospora sp. DSM 101779]